MTWLTHKAPRQDELAQRLRRRLAAKGEGILVLPGVYDGLSALMAQRAGMEALYLSGAAYTASRGWPDLGLVESEEMTRRARDIVRATGLPLVVDVDTGYGGVLNVARMAREMVEAGAAGVQLEDQELPKKCGHLTGKRLLPAEEMVEKIVALRQVAPTLLVVARTDARGVEGLGEAVARAQRYAQAGADAIFVEALESEEEFRQVAQEVPAPLVANLTEFGRSPYLSAGTLEAMGYRAVLFPVSALRMAAKAYEELFATLRQEGTQVSLLGRMQTRAELYEVLDYFSYEELDRHIARSRLPDEPPKTPGAWAGQADPEEGGR
jgi:methylisocitrate lyase